MIFLIAATGSTEVPALAVKKFECPIAVIGSEIRPPVVRNDILVDHYTIDLAGIVPPHFIKLPMSLSILPPRLRSSFEFFRESPRESKCQI